MTPRRPRRLPWWAATLLLACRPAAAPTPAIEARTAASRVVVARSGPAAEGWRLTYRNQTDGALRCRANLRWREDHPPRDEVEVVSQSFEIAARAELDVDFPRPARPAGATDYALIEAEEGGLYLTCEPAK